MFADGTIRNCTFDAHRSKAECLSRVETELRASFPRKLTGRTIPMNPAPNPYRKTPDRV